MNKVVGEDFLYKKSGSAFPVAFHQKAVDALTFYTGVRNRHIDMNVDRHKNACHEGWQVSPPSGMKCITKLYRKIEFFYTGTIKTEANPQTLLHTSFNCYECPIFKECN